MPKNPVGVVPSDGSVSLFNKILGKTYNDVYGTLDSLNPADKFRRQQTLNQIKGIINNADAATQAWVKVNVPGFYEMGMFETVKGLNDRGSLVNINGDFAHFHKEAIEALASDTYTTIASGMAGMEKNAIVMINNATKQNVFDKIAAGQITGETRKAMRDAIQKELQKQGLTALVDKGGRSWDLQRYGDMLARTQLTRAHNSGVANRMAGGGYDLVMVSSHYTSCPLCSPWQSEVLSLSGETPDYQTVQDAMDGGLFHPNCRHIYTPYHNEYFDNAQVWDTEQQKYVGMEEMRANNFYKEQFNVISGQESKLFDYTKDGFMKSQLFSSTVGMKKQYSESGIAFDGSEVLPTKMTDHIVDDMGRKIEMNYPELADRDILAKMHAALDGKEYKTLEELQTDIANMAKSLGVPADPFSARLKEVETTYLNPKTAKLEKLAVLDPVNGSTLFSAVGDDHSVGIPKDVWGKLKDTVVTHNHPNGTSFSLEDMLLANKLDVSSIRAVGANTTYELLRPAEGWKASAAEVRRMYQLSADSVSKEIMDIKADKNIVNVNAEIIDRVVSQTAGALGWIYKKTTL